MKKLFLLLLFLITSYAVFSQDNNFPSFMVELNTGYAAGINLDNTIFFDVKLYYPYERFGFIAEAGGLFSADFSAFHLFLGPMIFFVNNQKWRVPLALGIDSISGETFYFGLGAILSVHRRLANHLYAGLDLRITYAFNNIYEELTGYKTNKEVVDDGTGNAVFVERTIPIFERKDHYGNYIYFKPSLLIGFQY